MKFILNGPLKENLYNLIRRAGYRFEGRDGVKSELIFIRPIEIDNYPRFHLYIKTEDKNFILDLHLDQKKPIYQGVPAHSAEYEGEVVEREMERIKEIIGKNS